MPRQFLHRLKPRDDLDAWGRLLTPLMRPSLAAIGDSQGFEEGAWVAWGLSTRSWNPFRGEQPCALMLARVIPWFTPQDESCRVLNIVTCVHASDAVDASITHCRLLLDHAQITALDAGLNGDVNRLHLCELPLDLQSELVKLERCARLNIENFVPDLLPLFHGLVNC